MDFGAYGHEPFVLGSVLVTSFFLYHHHIICVCACIHCFALSENKNCSGKVKTRVNLASLLTVGGGGASEIIPTLSTNMFLSPGT
jgi:hypothetical protein